MTRGKSEGRDLLLNSIVFKDIIFEKRSKRNKETWGNRGIVERGDHKCKHPGVRIARCFQGTASVDLRSKEEGR